MLLPCWWGGVGVGDVNVPCTSYMIYCHAGTIDAAWSAVKNFIPNSLSAKSKDLLLYVKCWQWRYVNGHSRLQQKTISTLKRLVWQRMKKGLAHFCQKPTRNANLAKFARPNLAKFCLSNCVFRCSENNMFFWKRAFCERSFRSAGVFMDIPQSFYVNFHP